jgi:hypothetical protein
LRALVGNVAAHRSGGDVAVTRVCRCGCGVSLEGRDHRAVYASPACKARDWRSKYVIPPQRRRRLRTNGRGRSGRTISYAKAVRFAVDMLRFVNGRTLTDDELTRVAEAFMRGALPDKQRKDHP